MEPNHPGPAGERSMAPGQLVHHSVAMQVLSGRDLPEEAVVSFLPVQREAEPDLGRPGLQEAEEACLHVLVRRLAHDVHDPHRLEAEVYRGHPRVGVSCPSGCRGRG